MALGHSPIVRITDHGYDMLITGKVLEDAAWVIKTPGWPAQRFKMLINKKGEFTSLRPLHQMKASIRNRKSSLFFWYKDKCFAEMYIEAFAQHRDGESTTWSFSQQNPLWVIDRDRTKIPLS